MFLLTLPSSNNVIHLHISSSTFSYRYNLITYFQISVVSHWIDGSMVYGSDDQTAQSLRAFRKGKLLSEYRGGREWLPTNVNRSMVCEGLSQHGVGSCYAAGNSNEEQSRRHAPHFPVHHTSHFPFQVTSE